MDINSITYDKDSPSWRKSRCLSNHSAQILTYMKLSGIRTGLLFNFHEANLRNGLVRFRL